MHLFRESLTASLALTRAGFILSASSRVVPGAGATASACACAGAVARGAYFRR